MPSRRSLDIVAVALACLTGCGRAIPFQTVDQGLYSGCRQAEQTVVRTQEEWEALWQRHVEWLSPRPDRPVIDFTQSMVLAVFLGERPTGGYSVSISAVKQRGRALEVQVEERPPNPGDMVLQATTTPYHLVRLRRSEGPVRFRVRAVRSD